MLSQPLGSRHNQHPSSTTSTGIYHTESAKRQHTWPASHIIIIRYTSTGGPQQAGWISNCIAEKREGQYQKGNRLATMKYIIIPRLHMSASVLATFLNTSGACTIAQRHRFSKSPKINAYPQCRIKKCSKSAQPHATTKTLEQDPIPTAEGFKEALCFQKKDQVAIPTPDMRELGGKGAPCTKECLCFPLSPQRHSTGQHIPDPQLLASPLARVSWQRSRRSP